MSYNKAIQCCVAIVPVALGSHNDGLVPIIVTTESESIFCHRCDGSSESKQPPTIFS